MAASKGKPCVRPIPINYIRFFTAFQGKPQKNCLPAKRPGDRKDVCSCLFALRSGEAVQDGCFIIAAGGNVGERGLLSHFGAARKTVERRDDHGAGHGPVRREGISAGSGHQSLIRAEQNVLLADRLGLDIREAGSGQQHAQQEQQRAPCQAMSST